MKEKPIIFNGEMVQAIQDGRKTQTRRVITRPEQWMIEFNGSNHTFEDQYGDSIDVLDVCPYGEPGDELWLREAWRAHSDFDHLPPREIPLRANIRYETDMEFTYPPNLDWMPGRYRHALFMPRRMSRITLEIVTVRVERVEKISFKDARAEGCNQNYQEWTDLCPGIPDCKGVHFGELWHFQRLWDSINESRGYGWDTNPFVWCVEFKRVDQTQGGET